MALESGVLWMATCICVDRFVQLLTGHQGRLRAYIMALLPDETNAEDVLQETNVVLWQKRDECADESVFAAWACKVAYYEVLGYLRDRARDRHHFDDELVARIAESAQKHVNSLDARRDALRGCLKKLSPAHQRLLHDRYAVSMSVTSMAEKLNKTVNAVSRALYQLRKALAACVQYRLGKDAA